MGYRNLPIEMDGCVEVRLHPRSAVLTLVGAGMEGASEIAARALAALKQIPVTILPSGQSKLALSLMVPSAEMQKSAELLHREFFRQVDPSVFAECQEPEFQSPPPTSTSKTDRAGEARRFRPLTTVNQN
jgi:hypothetical protein